MPAPGGCVGGRAHEWGEWRYSEAQAGAIRTCGRCGTTVDRAGGVVAAPHRGPEPATPASSVVAVMQALGGSIFADEGKGDFATAAVRADALRDAAGDDAGRCDAAITRALVHLLQSEPGPASRLAAEALERAGGDPDRTLRALSCTLAAIHQQYNTFPDGNGVGAVEVSARWQGATDLQPLDARWQDAVRRASDPNAQLEAWLLHSFGGQVQAARYSIEGSRNAPSALPRAQLMEFALSPATRLHDMAAGAGASAVAAWADLTAADLYRRAGDLAQARVALERALAGYRAAEDLAGQALCLMTRADWTCAPFSSPIAWNLALVDSSSAGSNLAVQVEEAEFAPGEAASYDEAERMFRAAGAERGVASIQLRRGWQAVLGGDWAAAAALAAGARATFDRLGDVRGAQLAATHLLMAQLSGAGVAGVDAVTLAREIGERGAAAGSLSFTLGLGVLVNRLSRHWLLRRGHFERALACSAAARALFEALGAPINATQCRVDQGMIHQAVGERDVALTLFERALDDYTALIESRPRVADNLRQRVIFLATDVYQLALQRTDGEGMERAAARLAGQVDQLPVGASLQDALEQLMKGMSAVLAGTGGGEAAAGGAMPSVESIALRQMADSLVRQSAVLAPLYRSRVQRRRGRTDAADTLLAQAAAAVAGVPDGEQHFMRAVVLAERRQYADAAAAIRQHVGAGGANAGFTGELTDVMKTYGGAHGAAEAALQERRTHEQAFPAFVMVRAYDDAWQHLQALERIGGPEWWKNDPKPWQPLCDAAEVFEARGAMDRALDGYDRAIEQLEARRAFLSRDELKVALASDKGAQYVYFLAARAAVRAGDAGRGFDYAERGKARALLDLMAAAHLPPATEEDDATREWREAGMQLQLQRGLLAQSRAQRTPEPDRVATLEARVAAEEARLLAAVQVLTRRNPRFFEAVNTSAAPLGAGRVRESLPDGTVLLEYFFLGEDLLAWAITRDAEPVAHQHQVSAAALERDIVAFHRACETWGAWERTAGRLSDLLLAPLAASIRGVDRVVIVPHGPAHALPFHALPFDGSPLGLQREVTYLPSASVLQWMVPPAAGPVPDRILVVGNPTKDLPAARGEAEFVARLFPQAVLLLEDEATEAAVRGEIARAPLLHFATHGNLDDESPLNSSIALAGDGELSVYELMLLRLQARLVVLSACSTAQGETTGGDDVLGLTRGLLAAGAQAALVSLWPVDDQSTALLMEEFYRRLREGASPAAALLSAQRHVRGLDPRTPGAGVVTTDPGTPTEPEEGEYAHPYHWAPFVLVGLDTPGPRS